MKIEKVNDNQIRCTLNKSDLEGRNLKLKELAYGTDKAKELFRDMMEQASYELGFDAEDTPLMIEAIPFSTECIVLVITKVEAPEELDTRFSRFSPSPEDEEDEMIEDTYTPDILEGGELASAMYDEVRNDNASCADEADSSFVPLSDTLRPALDRFFDMLSKDEAKDAKQKAGDTKLPEEVMEKLPPVTKLYMFRSLEDLTRACHVISSCFCGISDIYKNESTQKYYLFLKNDGLTQNRHDFSRACNILSEYGKQQTSSAPIEAYFKEHLTCMISGNAVDVLSSI